jgi:hypothetical protein
LDLLCKAAPSEHWASVPLADGRQMLLIADSGDQGAPSTALVAMTHVVLHACPLSSGAEKLALLPASPDLSAAAAHHLGTFESGFV